MDFSGKKVLITAGPTWVAIDKVRIISNIATGQTGIKLAELFNRYKAKVTLLLGAAGNKDYPIDKKIKVIRFKFFDELNEILKVTLSRERFDIVIQTAAVSDYRPEKSYTSKIKSGIKKLTLTLIPTVKIIKQIKRIAPFVFLVGFKFEVSMSKNKLIQSANKLMKQNNLDLAVANTISKQGYQAYILNKQSYNGPFTDKNKLIYSLVREIGEHLCQISPYRRR